MRKSLKLALLCSVLCALFSVPSLGQQKCACVSGCTLTADPFVADAIAPTSCAVFMGGNLLNNAPVVPASTIRTSNASTCLPASPAYVPGPASNVACAVPLSALPLGSVTLTMQTINANGTAMSAPFTFTNVATLPVVGLPKNLRVP